MRVICLVALLLVCIGAAAMGDDDLVSDLPGNSNYGRGLIRMNTSEVDNNLDGEFEISSTTNHYYNKQGLRVMVITETNNDADPEIDQVVRATYIYDKNGNILTSLQETDLDLDGTPDRILTRTFVYNLQGLPRQLVVYQDYPPTPPLTQTTDYFYNNRHQLVGLATTTDRECDGDIDAISFTTRTNDARGNPLTEYTETDNDADDTMDATSTRTYTWDPRGNIRQALTTLWERDDDNNGTIDYVQTITNEFDARGLQIRQTTRTDSIVDSVQVVSYDYDNKGNVIKQTIIVDTDNDGDPDSRTVLTYYR